MKGIIVAETARTSLVILNGNNAELIRDYYLQNKLHLARWEPIRDSSFYDVKTWQALLCESQRLFEENAAVKLVVLDKAHTEVIGVCNFTNIIRGVFQACNLGYSISYKYEGQGLMHEVLDAGIKYMFNDVGLHRVMANYMPENERSEAVLTRLGFQREGFARSYLKINGKWQDHILTSKISPKN